MDHFNQLRRQLSNYLLAWIIGLNVLVIGTFWGLSQYTDISSIIIAGVLLVISVIAATVIANRFTNRALIPLKALRQVILHIGPAQQENEAPKLDQLRLGQEMVASLAAQVYQLASVAEKAAGEQQTIAKDLHNNFIAENLPLPLFVLDASETIIFANEAAANYVGIASQDMIGKNVYMVLDMSFPSEETFDNWLKAVKTNSATASASWERVRLNVRDDHPIRLFDLAAYYNRDNPDHRETMLVLFDHTKAYSQDDQAVSFTALAVHELRTPLTLLRGYIEVFEEELGDNPDPVLQSFMPKMKAMADQLTAFVNNILNVARVESDQLELRLQSEDWRAILKGAVDLISLRAKVRNITLQCRVRLDLPPVGVDRLSIQEVINNLIDNAIKYSGDSRLIKVESYLNAEGYVETTIQDFGVGMPPNVIPNLFTKFYRDHRNRAQIGGTGLGLYLSKAIIEAHGGHLWVRSQEGQGSTFGFTILPYDKLTDEKKKAGDEGIVRSAHGWIKNHSLYRQ